MAVQNPDFSAYVQRAKDLNPQGIFIMIPGGSQPARLRQGAGRARHRSAKDRDLGQAEITDEHALASMGDVAIGIITAGNYD